MTAIDVEMQRLHALRAIQSGLLRLKRLAAATRFEIAMHRHERALKAGFNPDQPRDDHGRWTDAGGNPDGGQWTDGTADIVLPEIVVTAGDDDTGEINDDTGGTENGDLIQLAGDIPTGDSPEIPEERPPKSRDRTAALKEVARRILESGEAFASIAKLSSWLMTYSPVAESYNDPPKSLVELQQAVSTPASGYDIHHIVQRNQESTFGKEAINSPENLVLIPRMKHWDINSWYETKNRDFGGQSPREYLNGRNWDVQSAVGLEALRKFGVIKP
jgi:hypothetical protein